MKFNERFFYLLKIIILLVIVAWLLFSNEEDYTEEYNAKIVALEQKVDSLHHMNDKLTFKIDTLNVQISKLDKQIGLKDNRIKNLKWKVNEKVNAVDSFNNDELTKFFTNRYRQYNDSVKKADSKISN
tara:strand:+ start:67 stop:450 length:384 start_codon:yes stop_codon:yes gene_type:complete